MALGDALRKGSFWNRFLQLVCGIVAFACVAEWADVSSRYGYVVFCGASTIVLTLVFMAMDVANAKAPMLAMAVDGVWWVFWLVAAALVSDTLNDMPHKTSRVEASVAFSWLTWGTFWIALFLDWKDNRSGGPSAAPTAPAV